MEFHKPVLLQEAIRYLDIKEGGRYIDCTFGFGGHAEEIIKRGGVVLGLDSDKDSLAAFRAGEAYHGVSLQERLTLVNGNFSQLEEVATREGFRNVDGILYDLGLSSWQLEHSKRGFSFQRDEPLDMRADLSLRVTAADLTNSLSEHELEYIFKKFGETVRARRFASALVRARGIRPLKTTFDLLAALDISFDSHEGIHPATTIFQALRIAVNGELLNLTASLPQAQKLLRPGGRLVVISFHSLEDRIVKDFGKEARDLVALTRKPVMASTSDVDAYPRARSAKLRAFERAKD